MSMSVSQHRLAELLSAVTAKPNATVQKDLRYALQDERLMREIDNNTEGGSERGITWNSWITTMYTFYDKERSSKNKTLVAGEQVAMQRFDVCVSTPAPLTSRIACSTSPIRHITKGITSSPLPARTVVQPASLAACLHRLD